jgi:putative FmdB family regulatory protein
MPTYDYICDDCGHEFEAYEPITAEPRKDCPECSHTALRRKIGPGAAILFKGSGFYKTDYRSESYKKAAKADKPADAAAKSSGDSSSPSPSSTPASGGGTAASKPASSPSS